MTLRSRDGEDADEDEDGDDDGDDVTSVGGGGVDVARTATNGRARVDRRTRELAGDSSIVNRLTTKKATDVRAMV
jgi:hypothetical protein